MMPAVPSLEDTPPRGVQQVAYRCLRKSEPDPLAGADEEMAAEVPEVKQGASGLGEGHKFFVFIPPTETERDCVYRKRQRQAEAQDRDQGGKGKWGQQPPTAGYGKAKGKGQGKPGGKEGKAGGGGKAKAGSTKGRGYNKKGKANATGHPYGSSVAPTI